MSWPPAECRGIVYLLDADKERSEAVAEKLAASAGLEVRQSLARREESGPFESAAWYLVGISNPISTTDLERLRELHRRGSLVAAYVDNATSLGIGRCCEALLAGAPMLLDSTSSTFDVELAQAVTKAVQQSEQLMQEEQRTLELMRQMSIVGRSSLIFDVFRMAQRISQFSDLPVLITGETGTGKELLAQAIYKQDEKRYRGPFVPLNCASLSRELSDSELFGHRKGAFTGAGYDRPGLFRSAHRGVLFLDEIGELDLCLQAKLLRVLQEHSVLSVGDDCETRVDVRVLAATHRNLPQMIAAGTFREDLFHRLSVALLHIPPLRERTDDIAALVDHFIRKHEQVVGERRSTAEPSFIEALEQALLPGNARQLENLVRRALIHSGGGHPLTVNDLPADLWQEISAKCASSGSMDCCTARTSQAGGLPPHFIDELLRRHNFGLGSCIGECEDILVHTVLASCSGNQAQAARMLGITPRSMYNKLRKPVSSIHKRNIASA